MSLKRHQQQHVDQWRETGFTIIPDFFSADEIRAVLMDFETLYGDLRNDVSSGQALDVKQDGEIGRFNYKQFQHLDTLPYQGSKAINLISLHPAMIALARDLLDVGNVHLYQSHTWAKYTGEADYDQSFHCDFGNHTLTVPSDDVASRTVDFIIYLTDVTDGHGALHYVTKQDANDILGEGAIIAPDDMQQLLKQRERSAASPAGTLVAHSIDTFHRGTNLTVPGGYRFTMTFGYKAAGNENIGYHVWQTGADKPWDMVLNYATPEQLACLGIPLPGDGFWTPRTLALTQARWPDWDMSEYFSASAA